MKKDINFFVENTQFFWKRKPVNFILVFLLFISIITINMKLAFFNHTINKNPNLMEKKIKDNQNVDKDLFWDSGTFSGTPKLTNSFSSTIPFIDKLHNITDKIINWRVLILLSMGIGLYLLLIFLKFNPYIAFIIAFSSSLSINLLKLLEYNDSLFCSVVYIPWILISLRLHKTHHKVLGIGLTSFFLIGIFREYCDVFIIYLFYFFVWYLITESVYKNIKKMPKSLCNTLNCLVLALIIAIIGFIEPLSIITQSIKDTIFFVPNLSENLLANTNSGETALNAILDFISIFYFDYLTPLSAILIVLAVIGLVLNTRKIKFLIISQLVSLTIIFFIIHTTSFKHFAARYSTFEIIEILSLIKYLISFFIVFLAGYGIKFLVRSIKEKNADNFLGLFYFGLGLSFVILVVALVFYFKNLNSNFIGLIKISGALLFLILTIIVFIKDKISENSFYLFLIFILFIELIPNHIQYQNNNFIRSEEQFAKNRIDEFLEKDHEIFRIYPMENEFSNPHWSLNNQNIWGYNKRILFRYDKLLKECLFTRLDNKNPINWNLVNMLNVKYFLLNYKLPTNKLKYVYRDSDSKITVYENLTFSPRFYFPENVEMISKEKDIINMINSPDFNPGKKSIIETPITGLNKPDSTMIKVIKYEPDNIKLTVETNKKVFLTFSEIFCESGWKASINNKKTEVYRTNYILRGLVIPEGEHLVSMVFTRTKSKLLSIMSLSCMILSFILILIGVNLYIWNNYKGEIEYVIKK